MFHRNQKVLFRAEFRQHSTVIPRGMIAYVTSVSQEGNVAVAFEGRTVPLSDGTEATGYTIPAEDAAETLIALGVEVAA